MQSSSVVLRHQMDTKLSVLYVWFLYLSTVSGALVQVSICPNESAVFRCSDTFTNWQIRLIKDGYIIPIGFTIFDSTPQYISINSALLLFEVTYNNGSFITVTLTINTPINLNESTIMCNSDSIQLILPQNTMTIPTDLILTPYGNDDFLVTWRPVDESNRSLYEVTVSPPPLHGPHVITHTTSLLLTLDTNTQYNITVTTTMCGNTCKGTFILGSCAIDYYPTFSSIQYFTNFSKVFYATLNCSINGEYQFHEIVCTGQGKWNQNISDICEIHKPTEQSTSTVQSTSKDFTKFIPTTNTEVTSAFIQPCSPPFIGLSVAEFVMVFVGVTIGYLLVFFSAGFLSGIRFSQRVTKAKKASQESPVNHLTHGPLYEEIEITKQPSNNLSQNVAYDTTSKWVLNNMQ